MVRQILKNMRVNSLQMLGVEVSANWLFVKLADAVLDEVGFTLLSPRSFLGNSPVFVVHFA